MIKDKPVVLAKERSREEEKSKKEGKYIGARG